MIKNLGICLIVLTLVSTGLVFAHDEPFIVCDVTVIDAGGNPVDGANVFVFCGQVDYSVGKPSHEKRAGALTNVFGHVRLQWPTGENDYFIIAYKPGLSLGWYLIRSWNPRQRIFLQLGNPVPLSGTVVDEDSRPVADATVQIKPQSPSEFNFSGFGYTLDLPFLKTRTDAAGWFTFDVLSDDMTTDFFVTHPQYAPHFTNARSKAFGWSFRPGQEGIVIQISKGCMIRGKVIDEQGQGVPDVPVHARLADATADYRDCFLDVSGRDGTFTLTRLPEETFILSTGMPFEDQSKWPGFGCLVRTQKDKPAEANIRILKTFPVEFVVIEPDSKRLIPNAAVDVGWLLKSNRQLRYMASGKTDGSGRLTLPCFPGTCHVTAWAEGYIGMWPTPTRADKNTKRIPIFLNPEVSIRGRILDAEGRPAAGIGVCPFPGGGRSNDLTNSAGSFAFSFQPMSERVYLLAQDLERNLCGLTEITEDQSEYTLRLHKGPVVRGKITDQQGQPVQGALVTHASGMIGHQVISDKNGCYVFSAVPPTRDEITYAFSVYAAGYGSAEVRNLIIENPAEDFTIPDIQLIAADCSVRGIVVDEEGKPLPNMFVGLGGARGSQTSNQISGGTCSDSEGRFFFPKVCPGPIQIQSGWGRDNPGLPQAYCGDQDLRVVHHKKMVHPEHPTMIGRSLPPLEFDQAPPDPNQIQGKQVLVCFWHMDPKVKKVIFQLADALKAMNREDISPHFVALYLDPKERDNILKKISFPVYDKNKSRDRDEMMRKWGVREIPWFIVTDRDHTIIYEGTSSEEALAVFP